MEKLNIQMFAEDEVQPTPPQETPPAEKGGHTEVLRELSRTFGVNLFDGNGIEQLREKLTKEKASHEAFLSEHETLKKSHEELNAKIVRNEFNLEALSLGVKKEQLDDVYTLSLAKKGEGTLSDGLKATLEQYKNVFGSQGRFGGMIRNEVNREEKPVPTGDAERYMASSKAVQMWENRKIKK